MRMSPKITELVKLPPSQEVEIEATETSSPVAAHIASPNIGDVEYLMIEEQHTPKNQKIAYSKSKETPRAIKIDTTTRAIKKDTTTPRAIKIDMTTPRAIEIDTTTPRAIEIDSTTPRAIEIDTSTPRAIKIGTTSPGAIEIDTTTPGAIKIDTTTPRAIKIDTTTRAVEIDTTTPRAIEIDTTTPGAVQIDTTTPRAIQIDTTTPRAIKIDTTTPRAIEIDTTTLRAIEIDTTTHAIDGHDRLKKKDKVRLLDILKKYNHEDADIDKLNKEMDDAINCLLVNIENDIDSLKAHKEMNQYLINKIMNVHKVIRNEKYCIQKQLELASRSCSGQNKRKSKEVELLNIAYNKLDQKERSTRRRIAILNAELSLIISKLDMPKSKKEKPIVPPLDLSKLGDRKVLPPLKNAPKAPRKGVNMNSLAKENFTDLNTGNNRRMKAPEPKLSNSTPILQNQEFVRPAPSVRDNRKIYPNKTGTLNGPRNQHDKKTVRQVIYNNKPVLTRKDEGTQADVLKLPDIVKGSQLIDKSKIVPKQACESRRTAPRHAARKPAYQERPPFCF
ncbi:unnamed protein product [Mytilus edulis]|uniref:Uncharacterized protein n=1 Tax=Mytilus edulis TaxID=6550 RepID=A0A8S3QLW0_MYTED|nr:unnamed protein product [Mytilus edulis]